MSPLEIVRANAVASLQHARNCSIPEDADVITVLVHMLRVIDRVIGAQPTAREQLYALLEQLPGHIAINVRRALDVIDYSVESRPVAFGNALSELEARIKANVMMLTPDWHLIKQLHEAYRLLAELQKEMQASVEKEIK